MLKRRPRAPITIPIISGVVTNDNTIATIDSIAITIKIYGLQSKSTADIHSYIRYPSISRQQMKMLKIKKRTRAPITIPSISGVVKPSSEMYQQINLKCLGWGNIVRKILLLTKECLCSSILNSLPLSSNLGTLSGL